VGWERELEVYNFEAIEELGLDGINVATPKFKIPSGSDSSVQLPRPLNRNRSDSCFPMEKKTVNSDYVGGVKYCRA
jgi:hypothetical protein